MTTYRIPPCMGGWCAKREMCARFHETSEQHPAERLCGKGEDNAFQPLPMSWTGQITRHLIAEAA